MLCIGGKLDILLSGKPTCRIAEVFTNDRLRGKRETFVNNDSLCKHIINIDRPQKDAYAECPLGFARTVCPGKHLVLFIPAGQDSCFLLLLWRVEVGYSSHLMLLRILRKLKMYTCSL